MIDEIVIQKLKAQDRQTQREVYDWLLPKLYFVCKRYLEHAEDIEDVLSESFYIIFSKIQQLQAAPAFIAWSRRIIVNQCLQQLKRKVNFDQLPESEHSAPSVQAAQLFDQDVQKIVNSLPPGSKSVFNLAVVEGYTHKEIAVLLNISEGTSKSQLSFAKSKLKHFLQKFYFNETSK